LRAQVVHRAVARDQEEAVGELGRERRGRPRERHRARDVLPQRHLLGARQEDVGRAVGRDLLELRDVVHDAIELVHQPGQVFLFDRQLRQLRHVDHVVPADAHALSHSRSRPA
jgi:hypothetical protein